MTLAIVFGGRMFLTAATVFIQREWAVLLSVAIGLMMIGFEVVEAVSIDGDVGNYLPFVVGMQLFYSVLGLAIFGLAGYLWMREYRSQHYHIGHVRHA